jgi:hypothetical protein
MCKDQVGYCAECQSSGRCLNNVMVRVLYEYKQEWDVEMRPRVGTKKDRAAREADRNVRHGERRRLRTPPLNVVSTETRLPEWRWLGHPPPTTHHPPPISRLTEVCTCASIQHKKRRCRAHDRDQKTLRHAASFFLFRFVLIVRLLASVRELVTSEACHMLGNMTYLNVQTNKTMPLAGPATPSQARRSHQFSGHVH